MNLNKLKITDIDLKNKRIFTRVDLNVPLDDDCNITDDYRIVSALPTIKYILEQGGKTILASHLGRPKGKIVPELSLKPVQKRLQELLDREVMFSENIVGEDVVKMSNDLKEGQVLLLQNLRFNSGEKKNDPLFSKNLSLLGDLYINDAFGTAHRAHSSVSGITKFYKKRAMGFLMEKELKWLGYAAENPNKPFFAVLGGAKISTKIDVIMNLVPKVDTILVGGAMAFTFLKAQGVSIGNSLIDDEKLEEAGKILKYAIEQKTNFVLPNDFVVAADLSNDAKTDIVEKDRIPEGWMGVDIGPMTTKIFNNGLLTAKTIFWNGPMGVFEMENFKNGTMEIAKTMAEATKNSAVSVVGGGDSVSAVKMAGLEEKSFTHISTGGGASLEFMAGKELPGITSLTDKEEV
ncbi:MAG: phosphoglycerate kinase [Candidatus Cloacimonadota bacterium]|nr:MAG: phosphoglycerate kinase [Candidatus Cloacimonadota bacterium]